MILSALYNYYYRKAAHQRSERSADADAPDVAPPGWEFKELPYLIVLRPDGSFAAIESTREGKRARKFRVPKAVKRTVQIVPNLLWDNLEYALGKPCKSEPERVQQMHAAFIERIERELGAVQLPSVEAVLAFLRSDPLAQIEHSSDAELWQQMCEENPFITFRIDGAEHACVADDIFGKWSPPVEDGTPEGICLVTGTRNYIERLHPAIKGSARRKPDRCIACFLQCRSVRILRQDAKLQFPSQHRGSVCIHDGAQHAARSGFAQQSRPR
ncbi:MAG: hypothetical protein KatS3mg038_3720 [Candidatus Kapaibacterium sp.]|nr:MAG: hypothetical protein KatS3mg038_3720 [Candidatus Kapabacteria bacterium]